MIRCRYRKTTTKEFVQWDMTAETSHGILDFHVRIDLMIYTFDRKCVAWEIANAKHAFKEEIAWRISGEVLNRLKAQSKE